MDDCARILIAQRPAGKHMAGFWEFPGGKLEPGETPELALTRELEEELAICNARGTEITRYEFAYPGKNPILLIFHRVLEFEGEPQNLIYREMRWEPRAKLSAFDFIEGDRAFIQAFSADV
jgi:8-oxo-dGTP diphosphatase